MPQIYIFYAKNIFICFEDKQRLEKLKKGQSSNYQFNSTWVVELWLVDGF